MLPCAEDLSVRDASRRRVITRGLALAAVGLPGLALLGPAAAAADEASRAAFHYQEHPNFGLQCAKCLFFVPAKAGAGRGVCRIIDGEVVASGWCQAFRPA